jgi:nickel-type superoxide dismutase maturation protease
LSESNLPESSNLELLLWLLRRRKRFQVTGNSMLPFLDSGQILLVDRFAYRHFPPQVGDIVVAIHPRLPDLKIVKRIVSIDGEKYFLQGDNLEESSDSRTFGMVEKQLIWGKVTSKFPAS